MFPGLLLGLTLGAPVLEAAPDPADAHKDALARFGAAIWNSRRDRLLTAARQFEAAAKRDPAATSSLRELVRLYPLLGREPDAIRIARQILEKDPEDFDTAQSLASLLFDAGQLKEAVAAAKLAARCDIPLARAEKAVGVYRDLATLCEKADDPAAAETAIRRAIELVTGRRKEVIAAGAFTPRGADTTAAECYEKLGRILTQGGKYEPAAVAFETAARLYRDPAKANDPSAAMRLDWNLSGVLQAKGDAAAALLHLTAVLKLNPLFPDPYLRAGKLYRALGREADIVPLLRELLVKDLQNLNLKAVLAIEMVRSPETEDQANARMSEVMAKTNDRNLVGLIVRARLERRPGQLAIDLDQLFATIKDGEKDEPPSENPDTAAAKAFAAEKARTIASILRDNPAGTVAVMTAAADDLRKGVKHHHNTNFFLAHLAARNGKLTIAEQLLKQARYSAPPETRGDVYNALIRVLILEYKPSEVDAVCQEALRDPKQSIASFIYHYYRASALADLGRAEEAIAAADKAIQETGHTERLTVRLHKVAILGTLRRWDESIAYAKQLFDEFPSRADRQEVRFALSTAYSGASKWDLAEAELRAVLDLDPDHAGACNNLGFELADRGRDLAEAERLIRHALEVDRYDNKKAGATELENATYLDSLGWVLFRRGMMPEARAELERAVDLQSGMSQPAIWDHLGDVLFRLGEKARAKAAWEKARELFEKHSVGSIRRYEDQIEELRRKLKRVP